LKWAVAYGADAVYFGVTRFSLRSSAGNFTLEDATAGLRYLHARGRRGYVTLNIYPFSDEYDSLLETASALAEMGADAFIVADLGVFTALRQAFPAVPLHISTQANTVSAQAALAYAALGARRVNLARELSLSQIEEILRRIAGAIETEVFIHGSVCFSYSGRCAISDYLTGRRANRGECTQSCRWNYALMEETRPGEYFPVFEDERGLYLFNSKDLALYRYVQPLAAAGVTSLKLEGRMKNAHYLATVVSLYRRLLDGEEIPEEEIRTQLSRVSNRGYSEGFMKGAISDEDYQRDFGGYHFTAIVIAHTAEETAPGGRVCVVNNSINAGETLELLTPDGHVRPYTLPNPLRTAEGEELLLAQNHHRLLLDAALPAYAILRRVQEEG
jgi:putative protease